MGQILYTRSSDGCDPVHVQETGEGNLYVLERPEGTLVFPSARQLLITVTQHHEARHWTLDRYFKVGRFTPPDRVAGAPILEAYGPGGWAVDPMTLTTAAGLVTGRRLSRRGGTGRTDGLGIDLDARGREVAKLLFAGFSGMIRSAHYDPADVLQEVYKGILVRNAGRCPFDSRKASFGHYVHMVCRCVLSNYHRRHQRYRKGLQEGLPGWDDDGDLAMLDAADSRALTTAADRPPDECSERLAIQDIASRLGRSPQRELAIKILPCLRIGLERTEIANELGESKTSVARACAYLRNELRKKRECSPLL